MDIIDLYFVVIDDTKNDQELIMHVLNDSAFFVFSYISYDAWRYS